MASQSEEPEDPSKGFVKEGEVASDEKIPPESSIPDLPENQGARNFLKTAPTKGLYMPLGKEVKVMQCWRCKAYGHRTGDRECPLRQSGNLSAEKERVSREDPMSMYVTDDREIRRQEKYARVEELKRLVAEIRAEEDARRERKRLRKETSKEKKKEKKEKKEKKHKKRSRSSSS